MSFQELNRTCDPDLQLAGPKDAKDGNATQICHSEDNFYQTQNAYMYESTAALEETIFRLNMELSDLRIKYQKDAMLRAEVICTLL